MEYRFLRFVPFANFDKWYVSYYINPHSIKSQFRLANIKEFIKPIKDTIKTNDYNGDLRIVEKISFKDGKIHIRDESKTGMNLYKLYKNDLLVSKINFHQGAVAINDIEDLVCSTHYQPYKVDYNAIDKRFLILSLRSEPFLNFIAYLRADGIKNEATYDFIGNLQLPLPPIQTQKTLVEAYTAKTTEAKQKEALATELEKSIDEYLTTELGIEVQKKEVVESKYKYLRFVGFAELERWDLWNEGISKVKHKYPIAKIQNICKIGSGGTPSRSIKEYYAGDIPWVKTTEVRNNIIFDTEEKINQKAIENSSAKIFPKNSLVMAMYGQGLTRGRISKLGIDASTNQACAVFFDFKDNINIDYVWFYLMSEYDNLRSLSSGNTQPNLNAEKIKTYQLPLPPLEIQNRIATHITHLKEQIKALRLEAKTLQAEAKQEFETAVFG